MTHINPPAMRPGLPELPLNMRDLPVCERGYPVPWFVEWIDGKPDHRIMDRSKMPQAVKEQLCWLCGKPLMAFKTSVIGPMCAITRTISEPGSHRECARYAVRACPFMVRPHAHRRTAGLPDETSMAGDPILRNPGVVCLWSARRLTPFSVANGVLFELLAPPDSFEWYAEGRLATRAEVDAAIESGLPVLREASEREGPKFVVELEDRILLVQELLDRWLPRPVAALP